MADEMETPMPEGVTVDRSMDVPRRKDTRGMLHMLRDELNTHFPKATDRKVGTQGQDLMSAVDEAVKGAPAPGSEEY